MSAEELQSYRDQLAEVELMLVSQPNNADAIQQRNDLQELIQYLEVIAQAGSAIEVSNEQTVGLVSSVDESSTPPPTSSTPHVTSESESLPYLSLNSRCIALWPDDNQWYLARITSISPSADQPVFSVLYLQYGNASEVHSKDIIPFTPPAITSIATGMAVSCVSGDGLFYEAVVESVLHDTNTVKVKFPHDGTNTYVALYDIYAPNSSTDNAHLPPNLDATSTTSTTNTIITTTPDTTTTSTTSTPAPVSTSVTPVPADVDPTFPSKSSVVGYGEFADMPTHLYAATDPNTKLFVLPPRLQPLPTDSETEVELKKLKAKRLRQQWGEYMKNYHARTRVMNWKSFQSNISVGKKPANPVVTLPSTSTQQKQPIQTQQPVATSIGGANRAPMKMNLGVMSAMKRKSAFATKDDIPGVPKLTSNIKHFRPNNFK